MAAFKISVGYPNVQPKEALELIDIKYVLCTNSFNSIDNTTLSQSYDNVVSKNKFKKMRSIIW